MFSNLRRCVITACALIVMVVGVQTITHMPQDPGLGSDQSSAAADDVGKALDPSPIDERPGPQHEPAAGFDQELMTADGLAAWSVAASRPRIGRSVLDLPIGRGTSSLDRPPRIARA